MAEVKEATKELSTRREADWPAVLFFIHVHLLSLYGVWVLCFEVQWITLFYLCGLTSVALLGVTTGAHRLWAHRTYEASAGLRIVLMLFQTLAGHGSIYDWVQNHRFHHAHFGTALDPYDNNKGFLYAQLFTRLRKLSPKQAKLKEAIDMSDLESDSVVMFQKKVYWLLYGVFFLLLPLNAPLEYWDESVWGTVFVILFLRYAIVLHGSWLIESAVCVWGLKQGEKYPLDSNSVFIINKTFWPQYHYMIPCDYKSGEFGTYELLDFMGIFRVSTMFRTHFSDQERRENNEKDSGCSTTFIKVYAALGLATKLRTVSTQTIQTTMAQMVKTKRNLQECLDDAMKQQTLPEDHYLIGKQ